MEKSSPSGISVTLFLSYFWSEVPKTHSSALPVPRVTDASSDQMTCSHWSTVQSLCFSAHSIRSRATSGVNFGRWRADQWEIPWVRSVMLRVLGSKSIPMSFFSCLQVILGFDRNWRNSSLTSRGVIDKGLPDLNLLASEGVVWSLPRPKHSEWWFGERSNFVLFGWVLGLIGPSLISDLWWAKKAPF